MGGGGVGSQTRGTGWQCRAFVSPGPVTAVRDGEDEEFRGGSEEEDSVKYTKRIGTEVLRMDGDIMVSLGCAHWASSTSSKQISAFDEISLKLASVLRIDLDTLLDNSVVKENDYAPISG